MRIFLVLHFLLLVIFCNGIVAQIKTHRPVSGNLIQNETLFHPKMIPQPVNSSGFTDPIKDFLNKTRSQMATGICFTEVPTASLLHPSQPVPAGNGSDPSLSKIEICCEGYERNVHNFKQCDPICRNSCGNGICVAPDQCVCLPNAIRNLAGYCVPMCPIGCHNGDCQLDGQCLCKPGYTLEPHTQKFCIPACSPACGPNGNCSEPNICTCKSGFELTDKGCVRTCGKCENGQCDISGECKCNTGYIRAENGCEPVCSNGCVNGVCFAPNQCRCTSGFISDESGTVCHAYCDKPCLNGFCSQPNTCSCNPGYILDEVDPHICKPTCTGGCPNGYCVGVNMCICKMGFVKERTVKGRERCVPVS